jgi:hypothetical protein
VRSDRTRVGCGASWQTQYKGRDLDRQALATAYDTATARILTTLERVRDDDFVKSAVYPGWEPLLSGEVSLARLFHYVKAHFETHEPQIRAAIAAHGAAEQPVVE